MSDLYLPRLRADQWAIATHPAKTKVVACGRRFGKTVMAGAIALASASDGARVAWVVPTYRNARPVWRWIETAVGPLVREKAVTLSRADRTVEFPHTGGSLGVYSGDNDVGLRGEAFHLAVLEEAARIGETTWTDVVQPALADYDGDAILISTPAGRNWYWREWQRGILHMDADVASFSAPSSANPMPTIKRAYELAKTRVPENVFRQEWDAEFVADAFDIYTREQFQDTRYDPAATVPPLTIVGRYISWDTGLKDKETSDYCACVVGELGSDYRLRVVDVWRDRLAFPNLLPQMGRMRQKWNADGKLLGEIIEDKGSGTSAYQTLASVLPAGESQRLVAFMPIGSKQQRASQAAVWCAAGAVRLPVPGERVPWLHSFEQELFDFPSAANDDQVDAFSQLVQWLEHYLAEGVQGRRAVIESPSPDDPGQRRDV